MGKSRALSPAFSAIRAMGCAALLAASSGAWAGNTVQLNATVTPSCTAFALPMAFGTLPIKTFSLAQTTTVKVDCPALTVVTIALDNGQNFGGGSRRMVRQGGQAKWLPYELYKDVTRLNRWGSTGTELQTITIPASGAAVTLNIYGFTTGNVGAGVYLDNVTVTLTY